MNTGTNVGTQSAHFLGRHARLLALGGLSLLLHGALFAWLDARIAAPSPAPATPGLAVRLAQPLPLVGTPPAPAPQPMPIPDPAEDGAPPAPVTDAAATPATAADVASAATQGGEAFQMPSRYRVTMPPAVTLDYEVRGPSGPAGEARLQWDTDGVEYRMTLDGILGAIESEGGSDDAGIAPQRASYRIGAGSAQVSFERERRAIVFGSVGRSAQDRPGSQDGATVLMQLAGIGLADPDQLQDAVDIYVGRADKAAVERFQVLGRERIDTPLGPIDTLHLARAGRLPLEIWLAPERGWLPVQLRVGAPDGSVRTQAVKEIKTAP